MTAQEAIKKIENLPLMRFVAIHGKGGGELAEALQMGIDALKKQIPTSPHYQYDEHGKSHEKCPKCGSFAIPSFYCMICGQKIDWGDSNGEG